jgi:hypothetical protein
MARSQIQGGQNGGCSRAFILVIASQAAPAVVPRAGLHPGFSSPEKPWSGFPTVPSSALVLQPHILVHHQDLTHFGLKRLVASLQVIGNWTR